MIFVLRIGIAVSLLVFSVPAQAKIRLRLTYDDQLTFRLATIQTSPELDFIIDGSNVDVYSLKNGAGTLLATRASSRGYYYGPIKLSVKLRPGVVDFYGDYSSHSTHARITTDGKSTCHATISNSLRPGHDNFVYEIPVYGQVNVYRVALSNIRCQLSTF